MSWVRRVLAAVIVALFLTLGSQPAHAASAPVDSDLVHGYVYDAHVIPTVVANGAVERGPPANLVASTSAPVVDLWSYGIQKHRNVPPARLFHGTARQTWAAVKAEELVATMTNCDQLDGRDEVLEALDALQAELANGVDWENNTLERFLDAFNALLGSIENAYTNTGREVPSSAWTLVGEALKGARFYE